MFLNWNFPGRELLQTMQEMFPERVSGTGKAFAVEFQITEPLFFKPTGIEVQYIAGDAVIMELA
jgi:hypothetical protein